MKGNHSLTNCVLLISIIGCFVLTAPDHVDCKGLCPDEFLDLVLVCQSPILPVFAPHLNTHPYLLASLRTFYFLRSNFLATILRC